MSISYEADGSILLRADRDPSRTSTVPAGTPRREQEAEIVAFFAADIEATPAVSETIE